MRGAGRLRGVRRRAPLGGRATVRCVVCGAPGRCASCGAHRFGIRRGGAERVEEWAGALAAVPVRRPAAPAPPRDREILVGGPEVVRDLGPLDLDLVGILDADLGERRPGLGGREQALATWMEAVGWASPHGRAIVQASRAGRPGRAGASFAATPTGSTPTRPAADARPGSRWARRCSGSPARATSQAQLAALTPITLIATSPRRRHGMPARGRTGPRRPRSATLARELAVRGVVTRVEAEPHL